jgi:mannosyl-oligosaccharide alpha-1,2-mannosidase
VDHEPQGRISAAVADIEYVDLRNTTSDTVNLFETNIRHLGGLLSTYELSEEKRLLAKATQVGEMLYHAFDTLSRMPVVRWDVRATVAGVTPKLPQAICFLAELTSFSMVFTRLSQTTDDSKWYEYLPKTYALLGGMGPVYQSLSESALRAYFVTTTPKKLSM